MKFNIDPDVFLSEVFQLRDELNDFGEAVTDERLTTIINLNAVNKRPELGLEKIIGMMKTIFITHSESRVVS